jgi:hypothetical protein
MEEKEQVVDVPNVIAYFRRWLGWMKRFGGIFCSQKATSFYFNYSRGWFGSGRFQVLAILFVVGMSAQAADVVWNFGSTTPGTTSPTSGTPVANLIIGGITQGTIATTSGSGTSYIGASGGCNVGFTANAGVLNTGTSAYFEFTLTPSGGSSFLLAGLSFGSRSTATGPTSFVLRSSIDNYASDIKFSTGNLANLIWGLKDLGLLSLASSSGTTFRIYAYDGSGSGSGNWRVDDVKISASVISGPVVYANGPLNSFSNTSGTPSGEQTFSVSGYNLTGDLTVTPPAGFEIKTAGDYTSLPLTILRSGVSVAPTTVTVRVAAAAPANPSLSGNLTVSSSGASDKTLAVNGTVSPDTSPFISVSTNALPTFSASSGSVSVSQSFTTAAKNLTNELTVTAPGGFQVSTNGVDFANTLTLAQTNGLSTNTVSVRVAGTNSAGSLSGNVVMASAGASSANVAVTATVTNPTITVSMNPALMYENATSTGTVTLPARIADLTINLSSGTTSAATVPSSVTLSAGQTSVNFTATGVTESGYAEKSTVITASAANCTSGTATLIVLNADSAPITPITLDGSNSNSYSQNFNGLGTNNIPSVFPASNGVQVSLGAITANTVNGWYGAKIAGTGTSATDLLANAGITSTGTLYSFGITNDVNRALGTIATGTTTMAFGALIRNDTGGTITNVKVSFTAEFWRNAIPSSAGGLAETNVLVFGYGKIDGTSNSVSNFLISSNALSQTNLNITGPTPVAFGTTPLNLDGSLPANQVQFSNVALPLSLAAGEMAFVRWQDKDNTGYDAGIGMDNFVLSYEVNGISNSAPTQIGLSATAIAENNAVNAVVGTLSTTDSDAGDTFTYDLVAGTGGDDNGLFNISGSSLRAGVAFNFEALSSYSIRVRTTDSANNTFEKVFTITVTNITDAPAEYKADWLAANALPDNSNLNSDPNSVGYSLATAYAFGLSPSVRSGAPVTLVSSPTGSVKIVYLQREDIGGVKYTVKAGTDLATGLNENVIPSESTVQPSPGKLGYTQYEATYTPSAPATKGFLMVQAVVP